MEDGVSVISNHKSYSDLLNEFNCASKERKWEIYLSCMDVSNDQVSGLSDEEQIALGTIRSLEEQFFQEYIPKGKWFNRFNVLSMGAILGSGVIFSSLILAPVWVKVALGVSSFIVFKSILNCTSSPDCSNDEKITKALEDDISTDDMDEAIALSLAEPEYFDQLEKEMVKCVETDEMIEKDAAIQVNEDEWYGIDIFTLYVLSMLNRSEWPNMPVNFYTNSSLEDNKIDKICNYYQINVVDFRRLFLKKFEEEALQQEIEKRNIKTKDPNIQVTVIADCQNNRQQIIAEQRKQSFISLLLDSNAKDSIKKNFLEKIL